MGRVELGSAPGGRVVGATHPPTCSSSLLPSPTVPLPGVPLWVSSLVWTPSGLTRLSQPIGHYQAEVFKSQHHKDA